MLVLNSFIRQILIPWMSVCLIVGCPLRVNVTVTPINTALKYNKEEVEPLNNIV
jgi:hypothetical protein